MPAHAIADVSAAPKGGDDLASRFVTARYQVHGFVTLRHYRGGFYQYDHTIGGYREVPDGDIKAQVMGFLRERGFTKPRFLNEVLVNLKAEDLAHIPADQEPPLWLDDQE